MGKHADATFLVVKEGRYTAQELEVSFKRLQQAGVKPNGFIINDMKEGSSYYPYYGYAYQRKDVPQKNSATWLSGFPNLADWLGQHEEAEFLPVLEGSETLEESVRV
jgi:tyrosine-protein kinase Etk/Wzc